MGDEMSDVARAHAAALRERITALKLEQQNSFKELGEMLGLEDLTPEHITPEELKVLALRVVRQLRRHGNAALADRYQDAQADVWVALSKQLRFLTLEQERHLTEAERANADAADEVANAVLEHFERVQAETSAYLKSLDGKKAANR